LGEQIKIVGEIVDKGDNNIAGAQRELDHLLEIVNVYHLTEDVLHSPDNLGKNNFQIKITIFLNFKDFT